MDFVGTPTFHVSSHRVTGFARDARDGATSEGRRDGVFLRVDLRNIIPKAVKITLDFQVDFFRHTQSRHF
jgi:hypothetical protein